MASSAPTTSAAGSSPLRCSVPARWPAPECGPAIPVVLVYAGLAAGVALAVPLEAPLAGPSTPEAQQYLAHVPRSVLAIPRNGPASIALVWVAVAAFRGDRSGTQLLLAGFTLAAAGSAVAGLGAAQSAAFVAVAAGLRTPVPLRALTVLTFCKRRVG